MPDKPPRLSVGRKGFIDKHGLWGDTERHAAKEAVKRAAAEELTTIRFAVPDQHGIIRGKTLAARLFPQALANGIDFPVAPWIFDTANAIVFDPFVEGGGFGMEEMTGDPNCILVPDPTTFTVLPWAPKTGWIICEMFFPSGQPFPFDARRIFRNALSQARTAGFTYVTGLEVEWYLTRMVDNMLGGQELGAPGNPAPAPIVTPAAHGFQYLLEDHSDEIDDILQALLRTMTDLGLPIRSLEDEWGPGQVEMSFDPIDGIHSADAMILFRAATKQVCRRLGFHASFMCKPKLPGAYSSGWHLHQSLASAESGANLFAADGPPGPLSDVGKHYVGGLLKHARGASVFTTPSINGYRRVKPHSLAPTGATWAVDNRAAMIRVQGRVGDPGSHIENRSGEPTANPYLYMASQLIAGLDGIESKADPGPLRGEPYAAAGVAKLPTSLREAVEELGADKLYRARMGDRFIDYMVTMKMSEVKRFETYLKENQSANSDEVTDWEQREYFRLF